jgi:hypothetical protein
MRKALRNTPPAYIDLIEYVKLRTRCTTGMAKKVLLSGALRIDSHPVGFRWEGQGGNARKVLYPFLEAKHRPNLRIEWNQAEVDNG